MDPASGTGEIRAKEREKKMIDLPFDEGQLEVSVVANDSNEWSKTAIISIIDSIGRIIVFVKQNSYSAWLPLGRYRIVVEYEGAKFDEMREVKLDEPTPIEVVVSTE